MSIERWTLVLVLFVVALILVERSGDREFTGLQRIVYALLTLVACVLLAATAFNEFP